MPELTKAAVSIYWQYSVTPFLLEVGYADIYGRIDAVAVKRHQIMSIEPFEFLQGPATLDIVEQGKEWLHQRSRREGIEFRAHQRVARNDANIIDCMQTFRLFATAFVKGHSVVSLSENIAKPLIRMSASRIAVIGPVIMDFSQVLTNSLEHGICVEVFEYFVFWNRRQDLEWP